MADDERDPILLGVKLLERADYDTEDLPVVMDILETVTTSPAGQREILRRAEEAGVIERESVKVRFTAECDVPFEDDVVQREGHFECLRCGQGITTAYFIALGRYEHGPFGSTCIEYVAGAV